MKATLLDTSAIVALLDASEEAHEACAEASRAINGPLLTCEAVIAESCYLLCNLPGAADAVLENVSAGIFHIPFQLSGEAEGIRAILRKYRDLQIDLADACLIRMADEFGTGDIFTLDKEFGIYRWRRNKPFQIIP